MTKKNTMLSCVAIAIATFIGMKTYETNVPRTDSLFMKDVEALADPETGSYGYYTLHVPQENKYGQRTGKCSATSWAGDEDHIGPYKTSHDHLPKECCSRSRN